jgi:hypothetical protein
MPRIYTWNTKSKGAKQLSRALGWPRLRHKATKFHGNFLPWVLNWGATEMPPHVSKCKVINLPEQVQLAANKLATYRMLDAHGMERQIPWFTVDAGVAANWLHEMGGDNTIMVRRVLNGHSGQGICLVREEEGGVPCPCVHRRSVRSAAEEEEAGSPGRSSGLACS